MKNTRIEKGFNKKIFTAKLFFSDLVFLIWNFPGIIAAMRNQKMTRTFINPLGAENHGLAHG